ncbi:MAG TPA: cytochrome C oxidase subunit IV family protein [Candidatus Acidoferrum sp.]|jgi:heme/copper-type cytochrome/quinol oxidase subunit 4|nr:cytochrome C oxidase subunit IV family protein [Candidatus Acidoferrum sp.]
MSTAGVQGGLGKYIVVYICMLAITGIEVAIAGSNPGGAHLLPMMLIPAFAGALLGVLFFMGLAAEKRSLIVCVAVFTLFVLATINYGWTDSFRVLMGVPYAK